MSSITKLLLWIGAVATAAAVITVSAVTFNNYYGEADTGELHLNETDSKGIYSAYDNSVVTGTQVLDAVSVYYDLCEVYTGATKDTPAILSELRNNESDSYVNPNALFDATLEYTEEGTDNEHTLVKIVFKQRKMLVSNYDIPDVVQDDPDDTTPPPTRGGYLEAVGDAYVLEGTMFSKFYANYTVKEYFTDSTQPAIIDYPIYTHSYDENSAQYRVTSGVNEETKQIIFSHNGKSDTAPVTICKPLTATASADTVVAGHPISIDTNYEDAKVGISVVSGNTSPVIYNGPDSFTSITGTLTGKTVYPVTVNSNTTAKLKVLVTREKTGESKELIINYVPFVLSVWNETAYAETGGAYREVGPDNLVARDDVISFNTNADTKTVVSGSYATLKDSATSDTASKIQYKTTATTHTGSMYTMCDVIDKVSGFSIKYKLCIYAPLVFKVVNNTLDNPTPNFVCYEEDGYEGEFEYLYPLDMTITSSNESCVSFSAFAAQNNRAVDNINLSNNVYKFLCRPEGSADLTAEFTHFAKRKRTSKVSVLYPLKITVTTNIDGEDEGKEVETVYEKESKNDSNVVKVEEYKTRPIKVDVGKGNVTITTTSKGVVDDKTEGVLYSTNDGTAAQETTEKSTVTVTRKDTEETIVIEETFYGYNLVTVNKYNVADAEELTGAGYDDWYGSYYTTALAKRSLADSVVSDKNRLAYGDRYTLSLKVTKILKTPGGALYSGITADGFYSGASKMKSVYGGKTVEADKGILYAESRTAVGLKEASMTQSFTDGFSYKTPNNVVFAGKEYSSKVTIYPFDAGQVTITALDGSSCDANAVYPNARDGSRLISQNVWGTKDKSQLCVKSNYAGTFSITAPATGAYTADAVLGTDGKSINGVAIAAGTNVTTVVNAAAILQERMQEQYGADVTYALKADNFAGRFVRITNTVKADGAELDNTKKTVLEGHTAKFVFSSPLDMNLWDIGVSNTNIVGSNGWIKSNGKATGLSVTTNKSNKGESKYYGKATVTLTNKSSGEKLELTVTNKKFEPSVRLMLIDNSISARPWTIGAKETMFARGDLVGVYANYDDCSCDDCSGNNEPLKVTAEYSVLGDHDYSVDATGEKKSSITISQKKNVHVYKTVTEKVDGKNKKFNKDSGIVKTVSTFRLPASNSEYIFNVSAKDTVSGKSVELKNIGAYDPVNIGVYWSRGIGVRSVYTDCGVFNTSLGSSPRSSKHFDMSAVTPGKPDNQGNVILSTTRWFDYYGSTKNSSKGKSSDLMFVSNVGLNNGPINTNGVQGATAINSSEVNFVQWYQNNSSGDNAFTNKNDSFLKVYYEEARGAWTDFSQTESGSKQPKSHNLTIISSKQIKAGSSRVEIYNTKTGKWVDYEKAEDKFSLSSKTLLGGAVFGIELDGSDSIPGKYWDGNKCKIRVTVYFPDYNRVVCYPIMFQK